MRLTICTFLILFIYIESNASSIKYFNKIEDTDITNASNFVICSNNAYYIDGVATKLYKIENNSRISELFSEKLSKLISKDEQLTSFAMLDTSLMCFAYRVKYNPQTDNGFLAFSNGDWYNFNSKNSQILPLSNTYDFVFGAEREVWLITSMTKNTFFKDSILSHYDLSSDIENTVRPFKKNVATFNNECYVYINSYDGISELCNNAASQIKRYDEFGFTNNSKYYSNAIQSYQNKVYFCNILTNEMFSYDGTEFTKFNPLTSGQLQNLRFDPQKAMFLYNFVFGNDGYLYLLLKEATDMNNNVPGESTRARVVRMTAEFEIDEVLDIEQIVGESRMITTLLVDKCDKSNTKLYVISGGTGYYVYDPYDNIGSVAGNNKALGDISIYPNPASDFINISIDEEAGLLAHEVQILNLLGIVVTKSELTDGNNRIDISNLPRGTYFIKVGDKVEKFLKM